MARKVSDVNIVNETCLASTIKLFAPLARIGIYKPSGDLHESFLTYGIKCIRADKAGRKILNDIGFAQKFIDNSKTYFSSEMSVDVVSQRYVGDVLAEKLTRNLNDSFGGTGVRVLQLTESPTLIFIGSPEMLKLFNQVGGNRIPEDEQPSRLVKCINNDLLMEKYIKGLLTPEKSRQYKEHIQDCENCAKSYRRVGAAIINGEAHLRSRIVENDPPKLKAPGNEGLASPSHNGTVFDIAAIKKKISNTKGALEKILLIQDALEEVQGSDMDPRSKAVFIKSFNSRLEKTMKTLPTTEEFIANLERDKKMSGLN